MIAELRSGCLLFAVLLFFILIVMVIALGSIMKPDRWGERSRLAGKARSSGRDEFQATV